MNNLVFNNTAKNLSAVVYGYDPNVLDYFPIAVDSNGLILFSPSGIVTVTATNFDIRYLNSSTDSVTVTATNLDIRNLSGDTDSVTTYAKNYVEDNISTSVPSGQTPVLTKDISPFSENSFFIRTVSGALITVTLQVAPEDNDDYYYDLATQTVPVSSNAIFTVTAPMKYARLRVQASTNTAIIAYYNGRA